MQVVEDGKNGSVVVQSPSTGRIFNRTTGQTVSQATTPTYSSGGSSGGSSSGGGESVSSTVSNLYADRINAARESALNALAQKLNLNISMYNNEIENTKKKYESLIDQSEVERYKSQRSLRESLANRGQLDSGMGRQNALNLDTKYGNQVINIKNQREQDITTLQNAIASLKADYENEKAQLENSYAAALAQVNG